MNYHRVTTTYKNRNENHQNIVDRALLFVSVVFVVVVFVVEEVVVVAVEQIEIGALEPCLFEDTWLKSCTTRRD